MKIAKIGKIGAEEGAYQVFQENAMQVWADFGKSSKKSALTIELTPHSSLLTPHSLILSPQSSVLFLPQHLPFDPADMSATGTLDFTAELEIPSDLVII